MSEITFKRRQKMEGNDLLKGVVSCTAAHGWSYIGTSRTSDKASFAGC